MFPTCTSDGTSASSRSAQAISQGMEIAPKNHGNPPRETLGTQSNAIIITIIQKNLGA